ncbi:STAS domain-containing protein [Kitasatospora mediocidica]|uniref:STAS domain-containing protein n=1 Tax=Kitasatospora mediocidica TaxID=58352 RepID=UPI0005639A4F|nr:STAS domain-containing protein [Kitasatospora mediocidica]
MSPLNTSCHDTAAGPVLRVTGDLDYEHAPALRRRVEELILVPGQCLVIDLSGLDFCDSSGITALLAALRHAQAKGADLALAAVPANILRIFSVVGLDRVFTLQA